MSQAQRKETFMLLTVSMSVSLVRVCLGRNLGTTTFDNPTHLNSTPTNNQRGEQAPVPKVSKHSLCHETRVQTHSLEVSCQL